MSVCYAEISSTKPLWQVQQKVDALLKNTGIQYDPYANPPIRMMEAIQNKQKVQAIKFCRESTGLGLKDAKEFKGDF